MIYLELFWTYFKIGLFTIGGGHAMIPLIIREILGKGWMDSDMLLDFIAISESTPGPFAVNIATFTGMEMAGVLGALCATIGVVLPSFIIITLIVKLLYKFMKKKAVQEFLASVKQPIPEIIIRITPAPPMQTKNCSMFCEGLASKLPTKTTGPHTSYFQTGL